MLLDETLDGRSEVSWRTHEAEEGGQLPDGADCQSYRPIKSLLGQDQDRMPSPDVVGDGNIGVVAPNVSLGIAAWMRDAFSSSLWLTKERAVPRVTTIECST